MTCSFGVSALGVMVRLEFDESTPPAFVERVRGAWADAIVHGRKPDATVVVHAPGDEDRLLERLSMDVTLAALTQRRGSMLMFHAAGIAAPDGRVIAFVGPSGRGKTTLSRALARRHAYVSDETITIGDDLEVFPYRKPLSIVRPGRAKEQVAPSSLGLRDLPRAPLRLDALVVLDRVEEDVEPSLVRLPLAEAVEALVSQMSYLPELPQPLQRLTALSESVGGVLRLTYSEAATVPPLIEDIFAGRIAPLGASSVGTAIDINDSPRVADGVIDAVEDGGSVIVLVDRTVQVLGGLASEVWRGTVAGLSRDEIVEAAVDRFGMPTNGDAGALVDGVSDELATLGLVRSAVSQSH